MTDEQKYEVECDLLGRCLHWIKTKMDQLNHARYIIEPPLIEWYQDPETDKLSCRVTVRHCAIGGLFNRCGIKATEPFEHDIFVPANYDLGEGQDPR